MSARCFISFLVAVSAPPTAQSRKRLLSTLTARCFSLPARAVRSALARARKRSFKSQVGQDRWVLETLSYKRGGFFVDVGAADGVEISNTFALEKRYGWSGICAEPNPTLYERLCEHRSCNTAPTFVSGETGTQVPFALGGLFSQGLDAMSELTPPPELVRWITCTSTSLVDLLDDHAAPRVIDYLSLDVEGYEFAILEPFDFAKYRFRTLTVEHNEPHEGPEKRLRIRQLLTKNGYRFVRGNRDVPGWGHGPIDDFYVSR